MYLIFTQFLNISLNIVLSNFGDAKTNSTLTSQLELKRRYLRCLKDSSTVPHGYCVINNSPFIENEGLRVQFNIFGEFENIGKFPVCYTEEDDR